MEEASHVQRTKCTMVVNWKQKSQEENTDTLPPTHVHVHEWLDINEESHGMGWTHGLDWKTLGFVYHAKEF